MSTREREKRLAALEAQRKAQEEAELQARWDNASDDERFTWLAWAALWERFTPAELELMRRYPPGEPLADTPEIAIPVYAKLGYETMTDIARLRAALADGSVVVVSEPAMFIPAERATDEVTYLCRRLRDNVMDFCEDTNTPPPTTLADADVMLDAASAEDRAWLASLETAS